MIWSRWTVFPICIFLCLVSTTLAATTTVVGSPTVVVTSPSPKTTAPPPSATVSKVTTTPLTVITPNPSSDPPNDSSDPVVTGASTQQVTSSAAAASNSSAAVTSTPVSISINTSSGSAVVPAVATRTVPTTLSRSSSSSVSSSATAGGGGAASQGDGGPSSTLLASAIGGSVGAVAFFAGIWFITRSLRKKKSATELNDELFDQPYPADIVPPGMRHSMRRSLITPPSPAMTHLPPGSPNPEDVYRDINQMRQSYSSRSSSAYQPYQSYQPYKSTQQPHQFQPSSPTSPVYQFYNGSGVTLNTYPISELPPAGDDPFTQTVNQMSSSPPSSQYTASGTGIFETRTTHTDDYSEMDLHKPDDSEINDHASTSDIYGGVITDDESQ